MDDKMTVRQDAVGSAPAGANNDASVASYGRHLVAESVSPENAAFIAAAREHMPTLVAAVMETAARLAATNELLDQLTGANVSSARWMHVRQIVLAAIDESAARSAQERMVLAERATLSIVDALIAIAAVSAKAKSESNEGASPSLPLDLYDGRPPRLCDGRAVCVYATCDGPGTLSV